MMSPPARRAQVAFARERGLRLRQACRLIGISRATPSYRPRLPAKDAPVTEVMKELSAAGVLRFCSEAMPTRADLVCDSSWARPYG